MVLQRAMWNWKLRCATSGRRRTTSSITSPPGTGRKQPFEWSTHVMSLPCCPQTKQLVAIIYYDDYLMEPIRCTKLHLSEDIFLLQISVRWIPSHLMEMYLISFYVCSICPNLENVFLRTRYFVRIFRMLVVKKIRLG